MGAGASQPKQPKGVSTKSVKVPLHIAVQAVVLIQTRVRIYLARKKLKQLRDTKSDQQKKAADIVKNMKIKTDKMSRKINVLTRRSISAEDDESVKSENTLRKSGLIKAPMMLSSKMSQRFYPSQQQRSVALGDMSKSLAAALDSDQVFSTDGPGGGDKGLIVSEEIIYPFIGFVIKTQVFATLRKLFINVTHSPRVPQMLASPVRQWTDCIHHDADGQLVASEVTLVDVVIPSSDFDSLFVFKLGIGIVPIDETKKRDLATACVEYVNALYSEDGNGASARLKSKKRQRQKRVKPKRKPSEDNINVFNEEDEENYVEDESEDEEDDDEEDEEDETGLFCSKQYKLPRIKRNYVGAIVPLCLTPVPAGGSGSSDEGDFNSSSGSVSVSVSFLEPFRLSLNNNPSNNNGNDSGTSNNNDGDDELEITQSKRVVTTPVLAESKGSAMLTPPPAADAKQAPGSTTAAAAAAALAVAQAKEHLQEKEDEKGAEDLPDDEEEEEELLFPPDLCADMALAWSCVNAAPPPPSLADAKTAVRSSIVAKKDDKPRSPRRGRKDKRNSRGKVGDPFDLDSSDEDEDHEHPDTDDHDEGSTVGGSQRHKGENAAAAAAAASAKGLEAHQRHYLRALKTWQRGHGVYVEVVNGVLTIYRRRSMHQISLLPTKVQQKVYAAHDETSEGTDLIAADDVVPIPLHRALPGGEDEIARLSLSSLDITYDERDGADRDLFYLHLDVTYDTFNVDALAYTARGRQLRRALRRQQRHRLKAQAKQQRLEERRKKIANGHYFSDDEEEDEDDGYDAKLEEELDEEDDDRYDYALDSALLRVDPDFSIAAGASAAAATATQQMSTTMNTTSNVMSLTHMSSTTSINKLNGPASSSRSAILSPLQLAAQTRQLLHATHARHINRLAFPSLFKDNKRITLQFHSSGEAKAWQLYLEQHAFFLQQTLPRYNNYCEHNLHLLNAPIAHIYKAQLPHYTLLKRLDVQFMPQIAEPKTGGNGASSESKGDDKKAAQDNKDALEPLPLGSSKVHHNHHLEHVLEEESLHSHNMYVPAQAGRRPSHAPSISTAQQVGLQLQGLPFHLQSPTNHNSLDPRNNSNLLDYHKLHNYNYNNQHPGPRNNTPATRLLQKLRYAYPGDTLPSSSDSEHNLSDEDDDPLNPNSKVNRMRNRRRNKRESRVRIPVTGGAPPAYTTCITLRLRTPTHTPYAHTSGVLEEGDEIVEMEDYADTDLIALAETHPLYPPDGPDRRKVWIKLDRGYLFVYETLSEMLTAHTASAEERLADLGASTATQILTLAGYRVHAKHKKVIRKRNYMSRYTLRKHIPVVNNPLLFTSRTSYATTAATSKGVARTNANGKTRRHQHPVANVAPPLLHHTSWMHPVGGRCDLIVELFVRSATGALDSSNMQLLTALKQHIAYADLQTQVVSRLGVLEEGGVLEVAQQIALLQQGMPVSSLATNKTRVQMTMHSLQCLVSVTLPPAEVTSDDDSDLDERRILPHVTLRAFRVVRPPFFDINMVFLSKNSGSTRTMNDVMMQWRDLLTAQYECFPRPTLLSANSSQAAASHITTRTANIEEVPPVGCFFACSLVYLQESHMLCFFHEQTLFAVLCLTRCLEKAQTRPDRLHSTAMLYGDKNALGMMTPSRTIQNHRPGSQSSMRSANNKRQMATQHQHKHHTPAPPRPLNSAIYQLDSSSDSDDDSDDDIRQMAADFDSGNHHGNLLGSPKNGSVDKIGGGKKRKKNDDAQVDSDSDRDYDFEPLDPLMQMLLKQSQQTTTVTASVSPVKNAPLRSSAQLSSKSPMGSNSSSMKMSRNQAEDLLSGGPETTSHSNLPDLQTLNNSLTNISFSTQLMAPKPAEANHSSEDERMGVYHSRQNRRKRRRLRRKQRHHRIMRIDGPDSSDSDDAEDHVEEEEESEGEAERDLQVYLHAVGRFQRHQNPPQPHNYFQSSSTSQRIQPAKSASTRSLLIPSVANIQTLPAMSPAVMEAEEEYFVELLAYDQRTYRLRFPCRRDFLHWIRLVAPHKRHHHQQQHNDSLRNTLRVPSHPGNLNLPPGSNLNAHLSSKGLVSARLPPHGNLNNNSNSNNNTTGNNAGNTNNNNTTNSNSNSNANTSNNSSNTNTTNKRGMNTGKDDGGLRGAEHTLAMSSAASSRISNKTGNSITPHLLATANSNMNSSIEEHSTKFVRGRLGSTPMNKDNNKDNNKDTSSALSNKNLLNPASIDNEATRKYTRLLRGGEKVLGAGIVLRQEKASSSAASSGFGRAFAAVASVANGNKRLMLLVTDFPRLLFVDVANNSAVLRGHIDLLIFDKCDSRTEGNSEVVEVSSSSNSSSPMTRFTAADENKDKDAKFWVAKIRYAAGK